VGYSERSPHGLYQYYNDSEHRPHNKSSLDMEQELTVIPMFVIFVIQHLYIMYSITCVNFVLLYVITATIPSMIAQVASYNHI
jgi:hypothetical protein